MRKMPLVLLGALLLTMAASAGARSVTPLSGRPWIASEASCFSSGWSKLSNNGTCGSGTKKWLFDAPVDDGDVMYSVWFAAKGGSGSATTCTAVSNSTDGETGWTRQLSYNGRDPWAVTLWVPSRGTLHADCDLPPGGSVSGFHYWR